VNGKRVGITQIGGRWGLTVPANTDGQQITLE
jgi:hypothetical protein